ncbi:MAG: TerB family tellurite resistance protein [Cytophagales bacterium]|nr:TerB family tellurite resistance protein [Cytophagales bacterium]
MLPIIDQISILVRLSKADNFIAEEERKLINAVGKRNGLSPEEIEKVIESPNVIGRLLDLPSEEKFNHLYMIIQLMKIDKKVHNSEIEFCEKIAMKLGYKPGVVADLSAFIYSDPEIGTDIGRLKSIANKQLLYRAEDQ